MKIKRRIERRNANRFQWVMRSLIVFGAAVLVIIPLDINGWIAELLHFVV